MSHYIVLVKQVPDVTQITDNAFDPETGNLMRNKLASVINELDAQALAFAHHMRELEPAEKGKIIVLSMGPPMADEVLRYCLSRGADLGVLLTDRALGGADTWATANPLANAIRKIVRDLLDGTNNYFIISGMQSVDGDTAQVPAQVAEELSIPCVAYATKAQFSSQHPEITRIISGGSQTITPRSIPAIITVAKYEFPLFATVSCTRRANNTQLITWGANDVKPTAFGVSGSKTRVIRVFPPDKTSRKCVHIKDVRQFAQTLIECSKNSAGMENQSHQEKPRYVLPHRRASRLDRSFEGMQKEVEAFAELTRQLEPLGINDPAGVDEQVKEKILAQSDTKINKKALEEMLAGMQNCTPTYQGEIWVVAEHRDGKVNNATYELIGKARELADSLDTKVGVALAGKNLQPLCDSLIAAGADNIYTMDHALLEEFDPAAYRKVIAETIGRYWPQIVLYAATPQGRSLAPMISYRLGCGLTADCTSLDIRDSSRKGEIAVLMQTRPALGGNVMATICTKDSKCQMATARPGVMKRLPPNKSRQGKIIPQEVKLNESDLSFNIIRTEQAHGQVNFEEAEIIISGGRGLQSKENYHRLLSQLCTAVSTHLNTPVERGASRAAVEQGFVERVHQVGQTGTAVGPNIYLAMGISGAIQHMIGVANSRSIFAINNDPHAPIFKQCDYYLVGNVEDIIPQLVEFFGDNRERIQP